jgi:hypothetical protein
MGELELHDRQAARAAGGGGRDRARQPFDAIDWRVGVLFGETDDE